MLKEVRAHFPEFPFMVDGNQAFNPDTHISLFREMDSFGLMMIEQPFAWDDLEGHARLREAIHTPVCLDESVVSPATARLAINLGACGIINIKPGRVGGIQEAIRIHDLCADRGIANWCGGMLETGVGRAHNLCLASLPNFTMPGDLSASARYFKEDVIDPPVEVEEDGTVRLPDAPGMGYSVNQDRLSKFTIQKAQF